MQLKRKIKQNKPQKEIKQSPDILLKHYQNLRLNCHPADEVTNLVLNVDLQ